MRHGVIACGLVLAALLEVSLLRTSSRAWLPSMLMLFMILCCVHLSASSAVFWSGAAGLLAELLHTSPSHGFELAIWTSLALGSTLLFPESLRRMNYTNRVAAALGLIGTLAVIHAARQHLEAPDRVLNWELAITQPAVLLLIVAIVCASLSLLPAQRSSVSSASGW